MKTTVPTLLSFNGGYADTAGYLALQGLFTSHVTGNFVTLGAALALGTSGILAKLLALPVFCVVIVLTRLASHTLVPRSWPAFETLLSAEVLLLLAGAGLAIGLGPFLNGDTWPAIVTGMTLVAAMAIQNAVQRIHLGSSPPTTIMTGTTTQIMIDLADLLRGLAPDERAAALARLRRMSMAVASFAAGAAIAALLFTLFANWCFALPPAVALLARVAAGSGTPAVAAAAG
jgi:uncharacterized membrane protein YoaK (UPF0700 family)